MSTLDPRKWYRRVFSTARRLLVESDIMRSCSDEYRRVLVIGAGHDPYRAMFPSAEFYIALDIAKFDGSTDILADATALPLSEESFECVIAIEVMEHVNEPAKLISEAYRVLQAGGELLVSVPFVYHVHADPSDYWRPTCYALRKAAAEFSDVEIIPQGNRLHSISDLITTAFYPYAIFAPLRIFNHILVSRMSRRKKVNRSTAPSGYLLVAKK